MAEASAPAYLQSGPTESPRITPAVQALLVANVALYFLQVTIVQPVDLASWLGYTPTHFPARWWSPLTYAFVHGGFWHLALNLFGLWMFGPRVEHAWGTRAFLPFYAACALGGWGAHYAFMRGGGLIGASAAVLGVMVAYAARWPDDEVYLFGVVPVKVRWFVVGLVVMNLASSIMDSGTGGGVAYVAHLGGLVTGWLYLRVVGTPASGWRSRVETAPDVSDDPPRAVPRSAPKPREPRTETDDVVAKSRALFGVGRRTPPRPLRDAVRREALDRVLDKIAQHGMGSLTADERVLLDDESRRLREPS
jgi:membrane associated rhomboid family serine protease